MNDNVHDGAMRAGFALAYALLGMPTDSPDDEESYAREQCADGSPEPIQYADRRGT